MGENAPRNLSALHEPLAAELMTPRKSIAAGNIEIGRERLLDSKQLKIIGAAYEQSPLAFEDATNAAFWWGTWCGRRLNLRRPQMVHRFLPLKVLPSARQLIAMDTPLWHRSAWIK